MKDKFYCCRFCLACVQRAIRIIVRFSADMVSNPFNPKKTEIKFVSRNILTYFKKNNKKMLQKPLQIFFYVVK